MHFLSPTVRETDEKLAIKTLCEFELRALGARDDSVSSRPGTSRRKAP